jgi:exodeoxyribonuclease VII large subunit
MATQRLDDRAEKLAACLGAHVLRLERRVQHLADRLASPQQRLERERGHLLAEARMLRSAVEAFLRERGHRLARASDLLESCSYERTLRRGYVIAYSENGRLVTSVEAVEPGDRLNLRFKDGEASARVEARPKGRSRPPARRRPPQGEGQGRLF